VTNPEQAHPAVRTYGGWRRSRGLGLFGLDLTGTLVLLGCVIGLLLTTTVSLRITALLAGPVLAVAGLIVVRVRGVSVAQLAVRRLRWTWNVATGRTAYRGVGIEQLPGAWDLPGVLAPTRLVSTDDGRGEPFGLVWNRRTGHLTATLRCAAASTWLADGAAADTWVANWHGWLASLGYLPLVRAVAVTVETAPAPQATLRETIGDRLAAGAPADAFALMRDLVVRSPATAADVETRVSITFDPAVSPHRLPDPDAAAQEVSRLLTGLEASLGTCGVTVLGRARAAELAGAVRSSFDPDARGEVQRVLSARDPGTDTLLTWGNAAPVGAEESWDSYRHDCGTSVTWGWQEAPRQQVTAGVLARLLSPGRFVKRVTLVYRPTPAGVAARMLENQVNAAAFRDAYRRAQRRDESARDVADRLQAQRAAAEEALGAGVVLMSLYVTATVTALQSLREAIADVEARADQCKLRLRRLYGAQAAGFAATLPVGVLPCLGGRR
jgi:hypothetical protein